MSFAVGPSVFVRSRNESVRRGDRVTLHCEAHGDQPLDISWRTRNVLIDPVYDIRYHLQNTAMAAGLASELTVVQSTLADRGEYSCVASNAYGHDHAAVYLQVQEPPSFPKNLHVLELSSRSVVLSWLAPHALVSGGGGAMDGGHLMAPAQPVTSYTLQFKNAQVSGRRVGWHLRWQFVG